MKLESFSRSGLIVLALQFDNSLASSHKISVVDGFQVSFSVECAVSPIINHLRLNETSETLHLLAKTESPNKNDFPVRECPCAGYFDRPPTLCPINTDTCVVDGKTGPIQCRSTPRGTTTLRIIWVAWLFWQCFLVFVLFFTKTGHSATQFVVRKCGNLCFRRSETEQLEQTAIRLIQTHPFWAAYLYRNGRRRRTEDPEFIPDDSEVEESNVVKEVLLLRTKKFCPPADEEGKETLRPSFWRGDHVTLDQMDLEMDHGTRCAICLDRLFAGDVVGDLDCMHAMHKECLKEWLVRQNKCPLCQKSGVAAAGCRSIPDIAEEINPSGEQN